MSLNLDSYIFQGDELLDQLDSLNAAVENTRYNQAVQEEINQPLGIKLPEKYALNAPELEYATDQMKKAHRELDEFFRKETTEFPIQTITEDEKGNISSSVIIMDTDADTYKQIANSFQEINGNLTNGNSTTNHSQVPSMITAVDHSQYLLNTWDKLQNTYKVLEIDESF